MKTFLIKRFGTKTDAVKCDEDAIEILQRYNKDWCIKEISEADYDALNSYKQNIDNILEKYEAY